MHGAGGTEVRHTRLVTPHDDAPKGADVDLDVPAPSDRVRISTGLKPYLWALGLTWALPAVLVLVGWVVLSLTEDAPACPDPAICRSIEPANGMLLVAAVFLMPVCAAAGLLAVTVIAVRKAARRRRAS